MSWYLSTRFGPKSAFGQYHSGMLRKSLAALSAGLSSMAFIAVYPAGVSHASPSGDEDPGQCTFVLTQPKVVQVSGMSLVSATLGPGPCTMHASPNSSTVCLSVAGSQGECATKNGPDLAEVRYPYQPGTTYVVKAEGCASLFVAPYTLCQNFGPTQVTL